MSSRTITFANQKGGSGKSLAANAFAAILNEQGNKVLVVDCDNQTGNLSSDLMADKNLDGKSLAALLDDLLNGYKVNVADYIYTLDSGIDILIGTVGLAEINTKFNSASAIGTEQLLKIALSGVSDSYDYIIVDTAGDFTKLSLCALVATDDLIIPVRTTTNSIQGAETVISLAKQIKVAYNKDLNIAGIFLNDVNKQTSIYADLFTKVQEIAAESDVYFMKAVLRHSTVADKLCSYNLTPSQLKDKNIARGLVRDMYELVGEYQANCKRS